jgi:hypothetical protein
MLYGQIDEEMKKMLYACKGIFQIIACECIGAYFQKECCIKESWNVCDRLEGKSDFIASIGCCNNEYQAIMTASINRKSIGAFADSEVTDAEIPDILGEFCNIFCGLLMDNEEIKGKFGVLLQALPLFAAHQSFFPKSPGIHGKVHIADEWMYIGYAIRKNAGMTDIV